MARSRDHYPQYWGKPFPRILGIVLTLLYPGSLPCNTEWFSSTLVMMRWLKSGRCWLGGVSVHDLSPLQALKSFRGRTETLQPLSGPYKRHMNFFLWESLPLDLLWVSRNRFWYIVRSELIIGTSVWPIVFLWSETRLYLIHLLL